MDWNRVEGDWKQMKGKVKERWGKLTDDDLTVIRGRRDHSRASSKNGTAMPRIGLEEKSRTGTAQQSSV